MDEDESFATETVNKVYDSEWPPLLCLTTAPLEKIHLSIFDLFKT